MLGRFNNDNLLYFDGDVSEFIIFDGVVNTAERLLVENYLSAKYDIGISLDLYAGDDVSIGDYDLEVAGIGQEADGSTTSATSTGLTVNDDSFLNDDGDYIVIGYNNPSTLDGFTGDINPNVIDSRWERDWYVDVTDVGENGGVVEVVFDFDAMSLPAPMGRQAILYRPNLTSQFQAVYFADEIIGTTVVFKTDVSNISDGYYTIGPVNTVIAGTLLSTRMPSAPMMGPPGPMPLTICKLHWRWPVPAPRSGWSMTISCLTSLTEISPLS